MNIEKVVIIIPTYNEALTIEETLDAVFQATASITTETIHVLVFDSASTDNTQQIVSHLQKKYQNLHLKTEGKKSGLGSAYRQAMQYALTEMSADIIFEFDADLSHQPQYLAPMLETIKTCDVVVGSRYIRGGHIPAEWGWHRKLLSVCGNYIARFMLTPRYKDFTSGFRATRSSALAHALPEKFLSNHYAYKIQLLWLLHKNKAQINEYPIEFIDRQKGKSKLPANSIIDTLRVLLILRFQASKRYLKMCMVGLSGAILQFITYNVLRGHLSPVNAMKFAVLTAIISNFILNNQFTFKHKPLIHRCQKFKSFSLFVGYSCLMICLQSSWLSLGIKYFGSGSLKENLIVGTGVVIGSFLNYLTYSRLVWRKHPTLKSQSCKSLT